MGLIAWFKMDGDATDEMGNYDTTVTGVTFWDEGKIDGCADYTGLSGGTRAIETNYEPVHNRSLSYSVWVNIDTAQTTNDGVIIGDEPTDTSGVNLWFDNTDSTIHFDVVYSNGTTPISTSCSYTGDSEWNHVIGVADIYTGELRLYFNGELVDTATGWNGDYTGTDYYIGNSNPRSVDWGLEFSYLDDLKIFDHALTHREAKRLSRAKVFHLTLEDNTFDCSGYRHDGNNSGGTFVEDVGIGKKSWYKDANGDEITTNFEPHYGGYSQDVTYSFRFKHTSGVNSEAVLGHRDGGSGFMFYRNSGNADDAFHALKYYTDTSGTGQNVLDTNYFNSGQWYHVVCAYDRNGNYKIFVDGDKKQSGTASNFNKWDDSGVDFYIGYGGDGWTEYRGYVDDVKVFHTYLTDDACVELYEQRASLDEEGNLYGVEFVETKYKPLLTNYTDWTTGTGSVGDFYRNGTDAENVRESGTDPFGNTTVIWKAVPDADSNADGGWNHAETTADKTKCYRYSVWIKRTGDSSGTTYLGCKHDDVKRITTGAVDGNPYFMSIDPPNYSDWFLYVGHIREYDTDETTDHPDSGVWNTNGEKVRGTERDFKWIDGSVVHKHRTYLYYCTNTSNRQYWVYPRIDVCDGTEPSIQDLVRGFDGRYLDYVDNLNGTTQQPMSITQNQVLGSNITEVGSTDSMIAWLPFNGDMIDVTGIIAGYESHHDGTNHGAEKVVGNKDIAYYFDGSDYVELTSLSMNEFADGFTWSAWVTHTNLSGTWSWIFNCSNANDGQAYSWFQFGKKNGEGDLRFQDGTFTTNDYLDTSGENIADGNWHHVVAMWDKSNQEKRIYFDGELSSSTSASEDDTTVDYGYMLIGAQGRNDLGTITQYWQGNIRDIRVYNKALSKEEVGVLYRTTGGVNTRMTHASNDVVAISGELTEV